MFITLPALPLTGQLTWKKAPTILDVECNTSEEFLFYRYVVVGFEPRIPCSWVIWYQFSKTLDPKSYKVLGQG